MAFVLDASIAACWALTDEDHPVATAALRRLRSDSCIVPALWWFEIRNFIVMSERRQRLDESQSEAFLRDLSDLQIAQDTNPDEVRLMRLSRTHQLTVYDAAYLELAQRKGLAIATLDSALVRAAHAEAVSLFTEDT